MIKQVYQVKKDGRKSANSYLILKDKEPIKVLTLATKGNEMKQSIVENESAKSKEKKLKVHKVKQELSLVQTNNNRGAHSAYRIGNGRNYKNLVHKSSKRETWHGFPKEIIKTRVMCKVPLQEVRQR